MKWIEGDFISVYVLGQVDTGMLHPAEVPYLKEHIRKLERVKKRDIKNGLRAEENHFQGETSRGQPLTCQKEN